MASTYERKDSLPRIRGFSILSLGQLLSFALFCFAAAWPLPSRGAEPASGAVPLCDLLARVQPGEKLAATVSGIYEREHGVHVLYDPGQRLCEYDVQPGTFVYLAEGVSRDEALNRALETDRRAYVTLVGTLWGPYPVPKDNASEPPLVAALNRVANGKAYGHLNWSRTQFVVEKVVSWRPVPVQVPTWAEGSKPAPISPTPVVIKAAMPEYPRYALFGGVSGKVVVNVFVKDGRVVETKVESGDRLLVPAVLENIATWAFKAGVNAQFTTTFTFQAELRKTGSDKNLRIELNLPTAAKIVGPLRATRSDKLFDMPE